MCPPMVRPVDLFENPREPHAVHQVRPGRQGHAARHRCRHRRHHPGVLPADVRRAPRARTRPVQPGQPGPGRPAERARGRDRRVRHAPGGRGRTRPARGAGPHRPQARLARHHRGPVPDRPRAPVRRHRRGARRRGHARGRRRLGRGLLAHGQGAGHHREAACTPRPAWRTATCGAPWSCAVGCRSRPTPCPSCSARPTAARCRGPPGPVRLGAGGAARRRPPDPPVQPHPRPRGQRVGDLGQGGPGQPHRRRRDRPGR